MISSAYGAGGTRAIAIAVGPKASCLSSHADPIKVIPTPFSQHSQHGGLLIMDNKDETPKAENENQLYDLLNDPEKIEYYLSRWGQFELEDNG
jgi:hypothetical protein